MRRSKNIGVALVGLLVVAAISVAAASGRTPPKEQQASVSLRRISASEVMAILGRFPGMVPSDMAWAKDDAPYLTSVFEFSEVTTPLLNAAFPAVRFYKGRGADVSKPPIPYLMAVVGDKRHMMPEGFNRLLFDSGLKVTDKNMIALAKAFVVLAVGSQRVFGNPVLEGPRGDELLAFPDVTFLEGKRIAEVRGGTTYDARLRVKSGEHVEEWYFDAKYGQFAVVSRGNDKGLIKQYLLNIVEPDPRQGRLDTVPNIDVDSGASVEWEVRGSDTIPHYYASVVWNDSATGRQVRFSLTGFPPNAKNVYVRVVDTLWAGIRHFRRVPIDGQGAATDTWTPPVESTGICVAGAGFADTLKPDSTYRDTSVKELTTEKVRVTAFADSGQWLQTRFCQQFFRTQASGRDTVYAKLVDGAMLRSWQMQVDAWNLGTPPDADHIHQVFINDTVNWYHGPAISDPYSLPGPDRRIGIPCDIRWNVFHYANEDSAMRVAVAHEFYHGIEWGLDSTKWRPTQWGWFADAQAMFLPSVEHESEELDTATHFFPLSSNWYLTSQMNTSLKALGDFYCLYWRFMYERFLKNSIKIVRDCYAEHVGTSNSISQGKLAIDRAIAKYWGPGQANRPQFEDFLHSIDSFAVACYLNDTSFGLWYNPNHVYSPCSLTMDDSFRLGPAETDSILIVDSIPNSYGFDLMQLRLNGNVDTLLVKLSSVSPAVKLRASVVRIFPATPRDTFRVDSLLVSSVHGGAGQIPTHDAKRVCLIITRHDTLDNLASGDDSVRFNVKRAVAVLDSLRISDTVIAGTSFTPRAVVANRGWMKEVFDATFKIYGTAYSSTVACTLAAGATKVVEFTQWPTTAGTFATCCSVHIASDTTRSDDTLRGNLLALADTWQTRLPVPQSVGGGGSMAAVGDTLVYALRGGLSRGFYCYDVRSRTWVAKESLPTFPVTNGASLTWDRGAYIYALRGSSTTSTHRQLFRYDINGNTWSQISTTPWQLGAASVLVWGGGGYLYAVQGWVPSYTKGFLRYNTANALWDSMAQLPAACSLGASLCWDRGNYIYALPAKLTTLFYRYSISANSWTPKAQSPQYVTVGGALAYDSLDKCVYGWSGATGATTHFWRYDSAANSWSTRATPPALVKYGGALASCAGFVYGLRGDLTTDFWRYAPRLSSGRSMRAGVIAEHGVVLEVSSFAVSPSPARGPVRLEWQVKEPGPVAVRVFDNTGRVVRSIQNGYQAAGRYSARWDGICDGGRRAASGIFFYRLDAPGFHKIIKVAAIGK